MTDLIFLDIHRRGEKVYLYCNIFINSTSRRLKQRKIRNRKLIIHILAHVVQIKQMEEVKKKNKYIIFFFGDCNVAIKWKTHTEKEM